MPVTDQISDFITRIRNAGSAGHKFVEAPRSNMKLELAKILKEEGFIEDYEDLKNEIQGSIKITLKYYQRKSVIQEIKRVSTPGRRLYMGADNLVRVKNGLGIGIVSTSKGIMTIKAAKKANIGGEIICTVW